MAFRSWPLLLIGAMLFGILFEVPIILMDFLLEGRLVLSPASTIFGLAGFFGYLCTGALLRAFDEATE